MRFENWPIERGFPMPAYRYVRDVEAAIITPLIPRSNLQKPAEPAGEPSEWFLNLIQWGNSQKTDRVYHGVTDILIGDNDDLLLLQMLTKAGTSQFTLEFSDEGFATVRHELVHTHGTHTLFPVGEFSILRFFHIAVALRDGSPEWLPIAA